MEQASCLLLKMLSDCGTGILPVAKNLVDKRNNSNKRDPKSPKYSKIVDCD
ncbi:hypothetical protein [Microcoleus sp. S13_C3]|uniref:hypothetical protein n=1 Tax=Microcoleus sp. S13_C3 TaxID=3055409 RepID=UPI002FCEB36C